MLYQLKDEENDGGEGTETEQNGSREPIIIDTEIEVDWGKKGDPRKNSANAENKTKKK
jgi:hypothetical protein